MDKTIQPIPAFYACYLLRSTIRHASLYVGSTPNPVRRLKQHNGEAKGGAARTSKDSLRPWEMTCLVTGFPSKIAALQFEWAWQNTHLTRHLTPDSRLTQAHSTSRFSPKSGRMRKRPARPRMSLTDRLANLHLLLRASSFTRWPLRVTFYAEDVFKVWKKWTGQHLEQLRPGIDIVMDESSLATKDPATSNDPTAPAEPKGIEAIDVGYTSLKPRLEKTTSLLENTEWLSCAVCEKGLPSSGTMTLVCPSEECNALSHIHCLSTSFLKSNPSQKADAMVPTSGACPKCQTPLQWVDLVKELSLRTRGEKEVEALFKVKRRTKKATTAEGLLAAQDALEDEQDANLEDELQRDEEDFYVLPDSSEVESESPVRKKVFASPLRHSHEMVPSGGRRPHYDPVIEDSDWDEAEILS